MRSLIFAVAALGFATSASAAGAGAVLSNECPIYMNSKYVLDANGQCRDAKGQAAPAARCTAPQTEHPMATQCTNAKTGRPERCASGQHFPPPPPPPP